jgi:type III restriction enzyme
MASVEVTYRYIVATPGIRGGHPRIQDTRIGVHDVLSLLQNGETVDSVVSCFPEIRRAQVYECLAYYEDHQVEMDVLIARQLMEETV